MVHLRIVVPSDQAVQVLDLLDRTPSVSNLIYLEQAARRPPGDVVLCDVAREDASMIVSDLRDLRVDARGSISLEEIDSQVSAAGSVAERAAPGLPSDAVVWEEVEAQTSESTELSVSFLAFMSLACMIATVAILLDSPILIIGAMVVGPEFGPIAAFCVGIVNGQAGLAKRSLLALAVGFPVGIAAAFALTLIVDGVDLVPDSYSAADHPFLRFIARPDSFSILVAALAGSAGVLSLTAKKSSALMGVLISVATIPAAANVGVAAALADWSTWRGALLQLAANLGGLVVAGSATLAVQRLVYLRRRARRRDRGSPPGMPEGEGPIASPSRHRTPGIR